MMLWSLARLSLSALSQANRASPTEPPVELDGEAQRAEFGVPDSGSGLKSLFLL